MTNHIEYRGYMGTITADFDEGILYGSIVNMDGGLMYEGETLQALVENMHKVIDDYLELCNDQSMTPRQPFSGKIALRIDPLVHARVAAEANAAGLSMNTFIAEAIEAATRKTAS